MKRMMTILICALLALSVAVPAGAIYSSDDPWAADDPTGTIVDDTTLDDFDDEYMGLVYFEQNMAVIGAMVKENAGEANLAIVFKGLNIRDQSDNVIGNATPMDLVAVTGDAGNGRVNIITADGIEGTVVKSGLAAFGGFEGEATVRGEYAYMRYGTGSDFGVMETLYKNSKITVICTKNGWSLVLKDLKPGYVYAERLTLQKASEYPDLTGAEMPGDVLTVTRGVASTIMLTGFSSVKPNWVSANEKIARISGEQVSGVTNGKTFVFAQNAEKRLTVIPVEVVSPS